MQNQTVASSPDTPTEDTFNTLLAQMLAAPVVTNKVIDDKPVASAPCHQRFQITVRFVSVTTKRKRRVVCSECGRANCQYSYDVEE